MSLDLRKCAAQIVVRFGVVGVDAQGSFVFFDGLRHTVGNFRESVTEIVVRDGRAGAEAQGGLIFGDGSLGSARTVGDEYA
jgi:hypothetical protein